MTTESRSGAVVAASTLKAKKGRRQELVALLAELARKIHAEPGCTHYSIHRPLGGDEDGPLLVVQAFTSLEAFQAHSAGIRAQLPTLANLLEAPPTPPTLYEPVSSGGETAKESFSR